MIKKKSNGPNTEIKLKGLGACCLLGASTISILNILFLNQLSLELSVLSPAQILSKTETCGINYWSKVYGTRHT